MVRAIKILGLAVTQVAAALALGQPADAHHTITCTTSYNRTSYGNSTDTYETGYGRGSCDWEMPRIDVRLTYVYCSTSSESSCNTSGSNFGGSGTYTFGVNTDPGSIYNLNGYYKAIVRTSFTLPSGHSFQYGGGPGVTGSCGESSFNYWSCAYDTGTFRRGL